MSSNQDNDKLIATKVCPIDLAPKITLIKGTAATDSKVPHLVSGQKISGTSGQIITHTVSLMKSSPNIISQGISSQAQLVTGCQANVVGTSAGPLLQGAPIISQGTQGSGQIVGQATVRNLLPGVRLLSPLNIPLQQHTHIATPVSTPSPRPQNTVVSQSPTTATKQLTTSYHVPRGPAAVASLAVPRGSAAPRAPTPSSTSSWSTGTPQCYVPRPPRPHTLQVAPPRPSLRQVTQVPTAAVLALSVRPSNTPSPQRTPPPQGIQTVTSVRPPAPKVVPLVQRNYHPAKVIGVAALAVRPTISPRTLGNAYYYEVSSGVAPSPSSTPPTPTQHSTIGTSATSASIQQHQQPVSLQLAPSSSAVTQTVAPTIVQQVSLPQQSSLGQQSLAQQGTMSQPSSISLQPNSVQSLPHSNSISQQVSLQQSNISQQVSLAQQNSLATLAQQASLSQSALTHQSSLPQQSSLSHQSQQNITHQQHLSHQSSLSQLSSLAHQSSLAQPLNITQHSIGISQQSPLTQQVTISSLTQAASMNQQTHLPLNSMMLQQHNQLTSFAGALSGNSNDLGRISNTIGGAQRPSILRKRDNEGSPIKSVIPPPPPAASPPHSTGGSTTVSAASSPGPDDDDPPPMQNVIHTFVSQPMSQSQNQNMQSNHQSMQNILQPLQHTEQPSYNNCSPRKKPRKQLLPSETRSTRSGECEFPSEGAPAPPAPSPPHAASPPAPALPPPEREKPRRRAMLGAGWKCGWRATALHFTRPTDVRRRDERRPSVVELAAQRHVLQKANGWKIHHLTAQMDDLGELETGVLEQAAKILKMLESKPQPDHHSICELLKGNIQRSKIVGEGVSEAKTNVLRIFQHKAHVSDILARQADKRCFKKHRNQC